MQTDELIKLMSADTERPVNLSMAIRIALVVGALVAGSAFFAVLGFRHDIHQAVETVRFLFKFVITISLATAGAAMVTRLVRPGVEIGAWRWLLVLVPVLLGLAVITELAVTPSSLWATKLIGTNALHCLTIIPILSIAPMTCLMIAMRHGAPGNPGMAGIVAALASTGIAATFYASNCTDDSPLFVATWYPLATAIVATAGFFVGRRVLRW